MPCEEYEKLQQAYQAKCRAEISEHDGYKQRSIKKSLTERGRTISERVTAETLFVEHMRNCDVCRREGRKGWEVDPRRLID